MGKYGGLSGQYYYKTKKVAEKVLSVARKNPEAKDHTMKITGVRGFWTLDIRKKRKKAQK